MSVEVKEQLAGTGSLDQSCEFWRLNSYCQAWHQYCYIPSHVTWCFFIQYMLKRRQMWSLLDREFGIMGSESYSSSTQKGESEWLGDFDCFCINFSGCREVPICSPVQSFLLVGSQRIPFLIGGWNKMMIWMKEDWRRKSLSQHNLETYK